MDRSARSHFLKRESSGGTIREEGEGKMETAFNVVLKDLLRTWDEK